MEKNNKQNENDQNETNEEQEQEKDTTLFQCVDKSVLTLFKS